MAKGSNFERYVCKRLSLWWTKDRRDDIFWRSSQSGGRATTRKKSGKATAGSNGDVALIDPKGAPFLDLFAVELKVGYNAYSLANLLDRLDTSAQQQWESWIQQAIEAMENSGSASWLIISRRDRHKDILVMDFEFFLLMRERLERTFKIKPLLTICSRIRFKTKSGLVKNTMHLVGMELESFLKVFSPADITSLSRTL